MVIDADEVKDDTGHAYFVRGAGRIKIGYSEDPEKRLQGLQCDSPVKQDLLGYMPGDIEEEEAIHERFSSLCVHGEWFQASADLNQFIDDVVEPGTAEGQQFRVEIEYPLS